MPLVLKGSGFFGKWIKEAPSLSLGCWCPRKGLAVLSPCIAACAQSGSDASVRHAPKTAVYQISIHPKKRVSSHLCLP